MENKSHNFKYCVITTAASTALTCISILDDIDYILTHLPFGSSPSPSEFTLHGVHHQSLKIESKFVDNDKTII